MRRVLTPEATGPDEPQCPVCAQPAEEFLRRDGVPVHQNLLMADAASARAATRGTLALHVCRGCGFVFNATFDGGLLSYGPDYDNTQTISPAFDRHVSGLVRELVERHGVRGCRVVEVGSGKGDFLRQMVSYPGAGNVGLGFDPSYLGPPTDLGGRVQFFKRFFDADTSVTADVVVCRHVIEHVPEPVRLLRSVREALKDSPRARVFFETPCVEWILRHQVAWDFFYEHCSLFTADTLSAAFTAAGFQVVGVCHVFGGQYLWLEARPAEEVSALSRRPDALVALARRFAAAEKARLRAWEQSLDRLGRGGPVAVWGAGAKGATFCNLADPDARRVACVVDINPAKQGKFVAGTGHAIVSPERAVALGVTSALVLNPNYVTEVEDRLARHGSPAAVFDLMRAA
jgi:SAM-dependent methyltransferase